MQRELYLDLRDPIADRPWYALVVRPRYEFKVYEALRTKEIEAFLPLYKSRRRWSDRLKVSELPLFPGYAFARFGPNSKSAALRCHGVRELVSFGGKLAEVDNSEISAIQVVSASGLSSEPRPYLVAGASVRVHDGPLAGLEGVIERVRGKDCIVLSIAILQRSVSVELRPEWVLPASA